jgi:hypothetical protein
MSISTTTSSMTGTSVDGLPIANIVLAQTIDEVTGNCYFFDTADNAEATPDLSAGKEDILRVKNKIIAMNRTEDICIGYNTKLKNNTFTPELMCIVDGGTMSSTGYEGPEVGVVTERHPYTLKVFSEEKDYDSSTVRYVVFEFRHCKGKPVGFKFEDGKFLIPEFESHSRPKKHEKPVYVGYVDSLPTATTGGSTGGTGGSGGGSGTTVTVPTPPPVIDPDAGTHTPGVSVGSDCRVTWTFADAINDADATSANFKVAKVSDGSVVSGNVTIDTARKVVIFVPTSIVAGVTYKAEALSVRSLLSSTADTTPISVTFTTA